MSFPVLKFLQVYVEFDDLEWEKREWVKVYEDFATFLVEYQLVWAKRKDPSQTQGSKIKQIQWPALVRHEQLHLLNYFNLFNSVLLRKLSRLLKWWWKVVSMEGEEGKKRMRKH